MNIIMYRDIPEDAIVSFRDGYQFLSNMFSCPIMVGDIELGTVEHAYVAHKVTEDMRPRVALELQPMNPGQAKRHGRKIPLRPDWHKVKFDIMLELLRQKFVATSSFGDALLKTGDRMIIEGNTWGDKTWGMTDYNSIGFSGHNKLGELLMQRRNELKEIV